MANKNDDTPSTNEVVTVDVLDASYPLLSILREKCAGTYAHSKNVASLLEALGADLKLNITLLKIAGQYHDIGKITYPRYFSENQTDEDGNPHDDLEPHISHKIITSHVGNTAQILINDDNIPIEVIKWCTQHHGNSVLRYFYDKSGSKIEDTYRYNCAPPSSLEAGLLMICDNLEATCRSLYQHDKLDDTAGVVDATFERLMADRQLDEIELPKLSYIRRIKEILSRELNSMYKAKRIDYDKAREDNSNDVDNK
jgi:putative nucleotidyltransferase with HDIG domain